MCPTLEIIFNSSNDSWHMIASLMASVRSVAFLFINNKKVTNNLEDKLNTMIFDCVRKIPLL
jgi:hypothetical protein